MKLEDIISYVGVAINQASDAKRDLMRGSAWGNDGVHSKQEKIDLLTTELSDADYNLDRIKDTLYQLLKALEDEAYNQELAALSPFKL